MKAFKEFNVFVRGDCEDDDDRDDVTFLNIDLDTEQNEAGIVLPMHLRCACHTLSLVATSDAKKTFNERASMARLKNLMMGKCSAL